MGTLIQTETRGRAGLIRLNRPEAMNALNTALMDELVQALEAFDARLPELEQAMRPGDLAIISADHGCDPTWRGTDHTREHVPVIAFGPGVAPGSIGKRESFADIGQSLAEHLGLDQMPEGASFLRS